MNIELNLLPEELRPKPPVENRTLLVGVLVVALIACCVFFFQAKGSADGEVADLEASIASVNRQIQTVSSNKDAVALKQSIEKLEAATTHYQTFVDSRVLWGRALAEVEDYVPQGIGLSQLTQKTATTLEVKGSASDYADVDSYFAVLDRDDTFAVPIGPTFTGGSFTLYVDVAAGGGQ
jgi:Tfp pilus assembly protein PilN